MSGTRDPRKDPVVVMRQHLRELRRKLDAADRRVAVLHQLRAQQIVEANGRGLSNTEVAELLGLTKQRVGQIAAAHKRSIERHAA